MTWRHTTSVEGGLECPSLWQSHGGLSSLPGEQSGGVRWGGVGRVAVPHRWFVRKFARDRQCKCNVGRNLLVPARYCLSKWKSEETATAPPSIFVTALVEWLFPVFFPRKIKKKLQRNVSLHSSSLFRDTRKANVGDKTMRFHKLIYPQQSSFHKRFYTPWASLWN